MKNKEAIHVLACALVSALMLSACEKMQIGDSGQDARQQPEGNVVVNVVQFEQTPFENSTRAAASDMCTRINFMVYDSNDQKVTQVSQKVGDGTFGRAALTLDEGDYQLVVIAHSSTESPVTSDIHKINFKNSGGFTDTFLYYGHLSVGKEKVETNLTLRRIVSKIHFIAQDRMAAGTSQLRFSYTGGAGTFDATTGWGSVASQQVVLFTVNGTEQEFDIYTTPHEQDDLLKVTVETYSLAGDTPTQLSQTVIDAIPFSPNKITTCRVNLFNGESTSRAASVGISIDDSWDGQLSFP
jgi:hypothetical protein